MYELQGAKLARVLEAQPDSAVAALGIVKLKLSTRPVIELDNEEQMEETQTI